MDGGGGLVVCCWADRPVSRCPRVTPGDGAGAGRGL